jgi:mannose/fructose/N-acetylgalactosamine-specific phosphotransferase system component IIB
LQPSTDIALVRVDDRLVHGQILEAWVPYIKATCLVVVDDEVAADFFRETVIRMAVPREVKVIISGVAEFAESFAFGHSSGPKTIILFSNISAARTAHRLGFKFDKLNIGNIYNDDCKLCCTPSVLLSDADIRDIESLHGDGVQIELRRVPREKPLDFYDILKGTKS